MKRSSEEIGFLSQLCEDETNPLPLILQKVPVDKCQTKETMIKMTV